MRRIQPGVLAAVFATTLAGAMMARAGAAQDTATLYKTKCAVCHGMDGKGTAFGKKTNVRDFASAEVKKETDREMITITTQGRKRMPEYAKSLSAEQIRELVAYCRTLGGH